VVDEGNNGSLRGQAQGDELSEGGEGSVGEGLLSSEIGRFREDMVREVMLETWSGLREICKIPRLIVPVSDENGATTFTRKRRTCILLLPERSLRTS
jgi:hypothetical protein